MSKNGEEEETPSRCTSRCKKTPLSSSIPVLGLVPERHYHKHRTLKSRDKLWTTTSNLSLNRLRDSLPLFSAVNVSFQSWEIQSFHVLFCFFHVGSSCRANHRGKRRGKRAKMRDAINKCQNTSKKRGVAQRF